MLIDWKLDKKWVNGMKMELFRLNPFYVDGDTKTLLEDIYYKMSIIKPEDKIDNMRHLWIETNDGWYCVVVGKYEDYIWLKVTDCEYKCIILCNKNDENTINTYDFSNEIYQLHEYIEDIFKKYSDNIEKYNDYISRYLAKSKRTGYISRKEYNKILGDDFKDFDKEKLLRKLCEIKTRTLDKIDMKTYAKIWAEGYNAYVNNNDLINSKTNYNLDNDKDIWECFSHNLESYKWNNDDMSMTSEDDFFDWVSMVEHHHGLQVIYARVGLYPNKTEKTLSLTCNHSCFIKDFFNIMSHYIDIDAPVNISNPYVWIDILTECDTIKISPNPFLYMTSGNGKDDKKYVEKKLPFDINKDIKKKLLSAIVWDPVERIVLEQ